MMKFFRIGQSQYQLSSITMITDLVTGYAKDTTLFGGPAGKHEVSRAEAETRFVFRCDGLQIIVSSLEEGITEDDVVMYHVNLVLALGLT